MSQRQRPLAADVPGAGRMPMLGIGTWENTNPEDCATAIETALEMGYRHIDTAQIYGNEEDVGRGIERADIPREDVFLATKVWIDHLDHDGVVKSTEESLAKLGVDAVDLLYVHWPCRTYDPAETLGAFDELYETGLTDRIAISNFGLDLVDEAVETAEAPIFANQVEIHPFLPQRELVTHCREREIEVVAYSPLARGRVFESDVLAGIAGNHDASAAQVSLAWLRERGITTIPKATSADHIEDNWLSLNLELSEEEIARIDAIGERDRRVDPGWAPWN